MKDSLQLNAKALNSFYEFSITPKPDEADESPDRHKSISSRSHSLTESRKRRLHSNRRDKKGEEIIGKEQVRDEARTIDQSVEGVQGMGGG